MQSVSTLPTSRPHPDRFLWAILIGIGALLAVAAVTLVLLRQPARDLPAGTPGATVQQFYQAMDARDYAAAYALLSDGMTDKPDEGTFMLNATQNNNPSSSERMVINRETITGDQAIVMVDITYFYNSGPFGGTGEYTSSEIFMLGHETDAWRITKLPYRYQPAPRP